MSCLTSQHSLICSFLGYEWLGLLNIYKNYIRFQHCRCQFDHGKCEPKHQHLCFPCFAMSKTWMFNLNASILVIVHTVCRWPLQVHLVFLFFFICLLVVVKYIRNSRLYAQIRCKLNAWNGPQNGTCFFPCVVYATGHLFSLLVSFLLLVIFYLFLCLSY